MTVWKVPLAVAATTILVSTSTTNAQLDCSFQSPVSLLDGALSIQQIANPETMMLSVEMTYEGEAWIAFGVSDNEGDDMTGSQVVIGMPEDDMDPQHYQISGLAQALIEPMMMQNLVNPQLVQEMGQTILSFEIPMDAPDQLPINLDSETTFVYAVGSSNTFGYHASRGAFPLQVTQCREEGTDPEPEPVPEPEPAPVPEEEPAMDPQPEEPLEPEMDEPDAEPDMDNEGADSEPAGDGDGALDCSFRRPVTLLDGALTIEQIANPDTLVLDVQVTYDAEAWVAFGVSDNVGDHMTGSQVVIGMPEDGGADPQLYQLSGLSQAAIAPLSSDQQTLINPTLTQEGGQTILRFQKPMNDPGQLPINLDSETTFVFAVGSSNTFGYHASRGNFPLTVTQCRRVAPQAGPDECNFLAADEVELMDGLVLNHVANPTTMTLDVQLAYMGDAWLYFGVSDGADADGHMTGSEVVVGLPDDEAPPKLYLAHGPSLDDLEAFPQGQQTLTNAMIEQADGKTTLSYTIPMDDLDKLPIPVDSKTTFVFAVGTSNSLNEIASSGNITLQVSQCDTGFNDDAAFDDDGIIVAIDGGPDVARIQMLWKVHGACMAIAWGIVVPIAIGASLLRTFLPPDGTWFKVHQACNTLAALLTVAAFGIAVHNINETGAPHFRTKVPHTIVGLIVFIFAMVQVANGILRPHLPHAAAPADDGDVEQPLDEKPKEEEQKSSLRVAWEYGHRILGAAILGMAWYNCHSGIVLLMNFGVAFINLSVFWGVTGAIAGIAVLGYLVRMSSPQPEAMKEAPPAQAKPQKEERRVYSHLEPAAPPALPEVEVEA